MRQVIQLQKNIIVFTSKPANMGPAPSPSAPIPIRNPLQPINAPSSSNTNPLHPADGKTSVKKEEKYSSPYASNENLSTDLPSYLSANTRAPAPYGPIPAAVKSESREPDISMNAPLQPGN